MFGIENMDEVIDILYVFGEIFGCSYFDMITAGFKMNYGIGSKNKIIVHKFIYTKRSSVLSTIYMHYYSRNSSKI